jgi:hypothetical protein
MTDENFTVADFFRLANEAATHESALRIKETEAFAEVRIRLAEAGIRDRDGPSPSGNQEKN